MNTEQMSMVEVAIELMKQKRTPQPILTLINEVLEMKGFDDPTGALATQLYLDITTSSDFVFCGEGKWDLKSRQSLDVYDRDGSYFNTGEEIEDEEIEDVNLDDYNIDEEDEDQDDYDEDEDEDDYEDDDLSLDDDLDLNEDDDEQDYLDEQEYNDIMDDYEDMYDN